MRRAETARPSLVDRLLAPGLGANARLERIEGLLDWPALEAELGGIYAAPTGRPSSPLGPLLRALLLRARHGLSDPAAEEAFRDRLSFRRFLGVAPDGATPDHNTLWRFREQLARRGLAERLLGAVDAQLMAKGMILKRGTLIDATLVAANVAPRNRRKDGRPVGPDARWTKRGRRALQGYKAHAAVDRGSGLVRRLVVTAADLHDSRKGGDPVQGDEAAVYAGKAYDARSFRDRIGRLGAADRVMHAGRRHRRLKPWQRWMSQALAPIRGAVERVFGTLKRSYGASRARFRNGSRNAVDLTVKALAYNLRRALHLAEPRPDSARGPARRRTNPRPEVTIRSAPRATASWPAPHTIQQPFRTHVLIQAGLREGLINVLCGKLQRFAADGKR
jgi:IS5 family transposase